MKKFTDGNDTKMHYAGNDVLKNELYDIIVETLTPTIDGVSENLTITGIDDLVNEFVKIVENAGVDASIELMRAFKPEKLEEKLDPLMEAFNQVNESSKIEDEENKKKSDDIIKDAKEIEKIAKEEIDEREKSIKKIKNIDKETKKIRKEEESKKNKED